MIGVGKHETRRPPPLFPRRCLPAAAGAFLLTVLTGAGWTDERPPQPARLVFADRQHDFGRVPQGDIVSADFAYANRGDVDLLLGTPRIACDCSAELSTPGDVAPGASGLLRVRFDTSRTHGAQQRTVTLYSSDPEQRSVTLTLRGEVDLDVVAEPAEIYLGSVTPGTHIDSAAQIHAAKSTLVHTTSTDGPYLSAALSGDSRAPILALQVHAQAPAGPFSQTVRVLTSSERHPAVEIPVRGIIVTAPEPSRWGSD